MAFDETSMDGDVLIGRKETPALRAKHAVPVSIEHEHARPDRGIRALVGADLDRGRDAPNGKGVSIASHAIAIAACIRTVVAVASAATSAVAPSAAGSRSAATVGASPAVATTGSATTTALARIIATTAAPLTAAGSCVSTLAGRAPGVAVAVSITYVSAAVRSSETVGSPRPPRVAGRAFRRRLAGWTLRIAREAIVSVAIGLRASRAASRTRTSSSGGALTTTRRIRRAVLGSV
jgi:hypothetical protein